MGFFELADEVTKRTLKIMGNRRMDDEGYLLADVGDRDCEKFATDFETDGRQRLDATRSVAVGTLSAECAFQTRAGALAGQLDQADVAHRQELRSRGVVRKLFGQGVKDQLPVLGVLHIDEIDNDYSTEVAKSQLTHDFDCCLEVQSKNGILKRLCAYVFPVSYTHLTLPTTGHVCRSRWWRAH
mgnify:CR=1 FL=1